MIQFKKKFKQVKVKVLLCKKIKKKKKYRNNINNKNHKTFCMEKIKKCKLFKNNKMKLCNNSLKLILIKISMTPINSKIINKMVQL